MISAPFFSSAIWSLIGEPPYAHTACDARLRVTNTVSNDETHPQVHNFQKRLTIPMYLYSQLSGGCHDNGNRSFHLLQRTLVFDVTKHREQECNSLARTCFRDSNDISSRHDGRNRLGLDRSRGGVVQPFDDIQAVGKCEPQSKR
jgi:hypothetical protein